MVEALPQDESYRPEMKFNRILGAHMLRDDELTRSSFLEAAAGVGLLHYHGHIGFHESLAWEHFLYLRRLEEVKAKDLFDLRLEQGAHVTLIGCQSGRAGFSASDNLMGLNTAFHYAGASSIISTLWKIGNEDGAEFSETFYGALEEQKTRGVVSGEVEGQSLILNMAKAMQKAVLKLREGENGVPRAPYHWAGFVFHGFWQFPG